jgi:hypothetical protein
LTRIFGLCSGDPFGAQTYSGSVRQLFGALSAAGALVGAADVERGPGLAARLALARLAGVAGRRRETAILARWSAGAIAARSEAARRLLAAAPAPQAALLYGTDFFPARDGEAPAIPVSAALDTTFAQLARAGEWRFADLSPSQVRECVARQGRILERCARLFARSLWCAESLRDDYGIPSDRIVVTGAGPNLDVPPPERAGYDRRTILFVGRDWARKNGPLVVDALRLARLRRPELRLRVVGPRVAGTSEPGIEWLGPLDGERRRGLPAIYAEASLFVGPSRFEPFGVAYLEAMSAGCPVVALDRGAVREIVEPGVTGTLLPDAEPRALAGAILGWLSDGPALERAGRAARERVAERFTWKLAAARILEALRAPEASGGAPAAPAEREVELPVTRRVEAAAPGAHQPR